MGRPKGSKNKPKDPEPVKRGRGRPKGSKNSPKVVLDRPEYVAEHERLVNTLETIEEKAGEEAIKQRHDLAMVPGRPVLHERESRSRESHIPMMEVRPRVIAVLMGAPELVGR